MCSIGLYCKRFYCRCQHNRYITFPGSDLVLISIMPNTCHVNLGIRVEKLKHRVLCYSTIRNDIALLVLIKSVASKRNQSIIHTKRKLHRSVKIPIHQGNTPSCFGARTWQFKVSYNYLLMNRDGRTIRH